MNARKRRELDRIARKLAAGIKVAERRFNREIEAIFRGVHNMVIDYAAPEIVTDADKIAPPKRKPSKDKGKAATDAVAHALPQVKPKVEKAHLALEGALNKNYSASMSEIMPIGWQDLPSTVRAVGAMHRDWSVRLVEDALRDYAADVRDIFGDPSLDFGERWETMRDALLERGSVSLSRANLIARDQTLKLNGAITQTTQQAAGVDRYIWTTSRDERVRKAHIALDKQVFSWAAPPEPGHPGQDYQCRCIAMPILDELA